MCERQAGKNLGEIKPDHLARYVWAAKYLVLRANVTRVLDIAAGVGYGSYVLAESGLVVTAVDIAQEAKAHSGKYFQHKDVTFHVADALDFDTSGFDAIVSFETIEHLDRDGDFCKKLKAPVVLASVPNQDVLPFNKEDFPEHKRHYTKADLDRLFTGKVEYFTQYGKFDHASVVPALQKDGFQLGRTIVLAEVNV